MPRPGSPWATAAQLPGFSSPHVHAGDKAGVLARCWTCLFPSVSLPMPSAQEGFPPGAARFLRGQEAPRRSRAGGLMESLTTGSGRPKPAFSTHRGCGVVVAEGRPVAGGTVPSLACAGSLPTEQLCWPECESCCMLIRPSCLTGFGC